MTNSLIGASQQVTPLHARAARAEFVMTMMDGAAAPVAKQTAEDTIHMLLTGWVASKCRSVMAAST